MKNLQNAFLLFMLILSGLALMLSAYQLVTVDYERFNYIAILVFNIPVLMSFSFCAFQLNDNFKK
jgi:hypothetical protein